jgi:glutathione peroxidase
MFVRWPAALPRLLLAGSALVACATPPTASTASTGSVASVASTGPTREEVPKASPPEAIASVSSTPPKAEGSGSLYDFTMSRLDGKPEKLETYRGKVVLVVNTASQCGFTPQYDGLEKLYETRKSEGFTILGFPSNDFGKQEPDDDAHIATFCRLNYGVTFPMFSKVKTTGSDATALYARLSAEAGPPKWNFHKYLIGKDGRLIRAFPSAVTPESDELRKAIDAALAK